MAALAHSTDRRADLRGAVHTHAKDSADPVLVAVLAYEAEANRINNLPGALLDEAPMPVWEQLENGPPLPAATTREGALAALRCAAPSSAKGRVTRLLRMGSARWAWLRTSRRRPSHSLSAMARIPLTLPTPILSPR